MPFQRPTLTTLRTQAMQDIVSSDLPNADGFLRRAVLRVLAYIQAGMAYLHYGFMDWIGKEAIPFTCDMEFLDGWAGLKAVYRKAPTAANGTWTGTGTGTTLLPVGTILVRTGDNFQYVTTAAANVSSSVVSAPFTSTTTGSAGNTDSGTPLSLGSVISGINSNGTASAAVTGGSDVETDSSLRTRMLQAYAHPPQGGAATDYVQWALAVPGVTRAWCNPLGFGVGTVILYTMFDVAEAVHGGFPQGSNGVASSETRDAHATGDQLTVANYIYPLRPVTALVYSYAPQAQTLNFTVAGLMPNTSPIQTAVTAAIAGLLLEKGSPLANVAIDQSDVDAAITAVPGVVSFRVSSPTFPQTPSLGNLFVVGTVTYA